MNQELLIEMIAAARALSQAGMMPGSHGNLSVRDVETGLIAITPHDLPYATMQPQDIVILDLDGTQVAGGPEPSVEVPSHLTAYRERPDVNSVIHTEPPYVNALAVVGREIVPVTLTGLMSAGGPVPITPFTLRRDEAFASKMLTLMTDRHAVIWKNHGLLVIGSSLHEALERSYGVEANAKVLFLALQLGQPETLDVRGATADVA